MATIDWITEGLPTKFAIPSGQETRVSAFVDDAAEVGAPRRRKRFTRTLRKWPRIKIELTTRAVVESILNFYDTTTDGGVLPFDFPRPRPVALDDSVETVTVRFIQDSMDIVAIATDVWEISFGVEEV